MPTGLSEYLPARTHPKYVSRPFHYILDRKTKEFLFKIKLYQRATYIKKTFILEAQGVHI